MIERYLHRIWDYKTKKMIYESINQDSTLYMGKFLDYIKDKNFFIMQSTGRYDKYGRLIYEGDLVQTGYLIRNKWYSLIAIIKWNYYLACFIQWIDYDYPSDNWSQLMDVSCEVIGNICENKDIWLKLAKETKMTLWD